jgi:hypothetical protein
VHIDDRHGEQQPPTQARESFPEAERPSAEDVIAVVDRLEERFEMLEAGRLAGQRNQDQRLGCVLDGVSDRVVELAVAVDEHRARGNLPFEF